MLVYIMCFVSSVCTIAAFIKTIKNSEEQKTLIAVGIAFFMMSGLFLTSITYENVIGDPAHINNLEYNSTAEVIWSKPDPNNGNKHLTVIRFTNIDESITEPYYFLSLETAPPIGSVIVVKDSKGNKVLITYSDKGSTIQDPTKQ